MSQPHRMAPLFASLSLMCIGHSAHAALAQHPAVHSFEPTPEEYRTEDGESLRETGAGTAVAIRNNTALLGMPVINRVGLFTRTSSGWSRTATIEAPEATARFGQQIAYRDGTAVIGSQTGAYVFRLVNGVWQYRQKLTNPSAGAFSALAYQDNMIVAGASGGDSRPGATYVFELNWAGRLVRTRTLQPRDSKPADGFGAAVSMSSSALVIGAPGSNGGATYVFKRTRQGWSESQRLSVADSNSEGFGASVAINNGIIVVGAPREDYEEIETPDGGLLFKGGAVFVFRPSSSGQYTFSQRIRPDTADVQGFAGGFVGYGTAIAMSGNYFAVLADQEHIGPGSYKGSFAFTYSLSNGEALPLALAYEGASARSIDFANNWLLVGVPDVFTMHGLSIGSGTLFDVNRFQ